MFLDNRQKKYLQKNKMEKEQQQSKINKRMACDTLDEIDHCTAFGPCSTRHMTPTSLLVCVQRNRCQS